MKREIIQPKLSDDECAHVFTPEVIAELRSISAEIKAGGKAYTLEEVEEHLVQKRSAWLANHRQ